MKRNLLVFAVMFVAGVISTSYNVRAQCPEDPIDLGICDTIYFEAFDYDNIYNAEPGSFDSVRFAIFVTHDSNTFFWTGGQRWVQDSIAGIIAPLVYWHEPEGYADSVFLPRYDDWNNTVMNPDDPRISRSLFRDLVYAHSGDTVYNRMKWLASHHQNLEWSPTLDIYNDIPNDSGHFYFTLLPTGTSNRRWWEGSRVLVATMTFLVYMAEDHDTTSIGLDILVWPPGDELTFTRYDAVNYRPRNFLPLMDTVYVMSACGDANSDGSVNAADVIYLMNYLFVGGPPPDPLCRANPNCNDVVHSEDVVYLLNYLFANGPVPCSDCCP